MKRFGIKTAPEGCGIHGDGACESCISRSVRRGRWMIRQVLPLTYRTRYHTNVSDEFPQGQFENLVVWKMWLGRCYNIDRLRTPAAA